MSAVQVRRNIGPKFFGIDCRPCWIGVLEDNRQVIIVDCCVWVGIYPVDKCGNGFVDALLAFEINAFVGKKNAVVGKPLNALGKIFNGIVLST